MERKKKQGDLPPEPDPGIPTSATTLKKKSNDKPLAAATSMAEAESRSTSFCNYGSMSPIASISQDHLFSILLLLPIDSILSFSMTCRRFRSFTSSDSLWESICKRDLGQNSVATIKSAAAAAADSKHHHHHLLPWMELYRQVYQLDCVSCYKLSDRQNPDGDGLLLPSPRASHSLNFVAGCLVLFGGGCEGGRHLDDTWVAYTGNEIKRTLEWKKINSGTPSGRFGHSGVVVGDSIVVFGGINDHGVRQNDTWVGQVVFHEAFDITLSWRQVDVGSTAPPPRGAHAGCCIADKRMLIHGGIGLSGLRLGDAWVLDLSDNLLFGTWREIGTHPSPPARSGHTLTSIGKNQTVLFGGRGLGYEVLDDIWLFDFSEDRLRCIKLLFGFQSISQGAALPRVGHSATLILGGRQLLIYGGEDSERRKKDDFWVLDVGSILSSVRTDPMIVGTAKKWRRLEWMSGCKPDCRSFHRACVDGSGCYLYVFGGMMDGLAMQPPGLRFDGEVFLVELLVLHL